jgi:hypothetical protein
MGFGSYDESEQHEPEYRSDEDDEEDVALHENDYEGTVSFESGASTDDLVAGLASIKEDETEE